MSSGRGPLCRRRPLPLRQRRFPGLPASGRRPARRPPSCAAPTPNPPTISAPRWPCRARRLWSGRRATAGAEPTCLPRTAAGWTQTAEVQGSDTAAGDNFGTAVAISGSTAVVGAPGHGGGRAYVFTRTATGWRQTAELKVADTAQFDGFGTALALSAATLVVSAPGRADGAGRVYVFVDTAVGWKQTAELKGADTAGDDGFGASVAVLGADRGGQCTLALGEKRGTSRRGGVRVHPNGQGWIQQKHWFNAKTYGPVALAEYLAVSGSSLLVGTSSASGCPDNTGNVFVFSESGQGWQPAGRLTVPGFGDAFSGAVAMTGSRAVVGFGYGTRGDGALLFDKTATGWKLAGVLNGSNRESLRRLGGHD